MDLKNYTDHFQVQQFLYATTLQYYYNFCNSLAGIYNYCNSLAGCLEVSFQTLNIV